ncbi:alpha-amylase [bacterium]|nr:MAG: alpha-amylase [bacterium]
MRPDILRFRQVHLDFHTSEHIEGIGADFNAAQFQECLKRGHVDSITLFSKCHHGYSYHSTDVGKRHPHLDFELLPRQIEACRAIDVKCPIYLSAGLDEWIAQTRPEWIAMSRDGKIRNPLQSGWRTMAFDTGYLDYLCEQILEVVQSLDASDGIFLDIIGTRDNFSPLGMANMLAEGIDPTDERAVKGWNELVLRRYFERTTAACKEGDAERRVFHNAGHIHKGDFDAMRWNSHLELESLPTGGWGYDHFPLSALYVGTTGFDFLGMTGKFHTTWGEFGGFKRPEALQYECAAMIALNAKCSIGDQLHPRGAMNPDTYDLIGAAYSEVEEKQQWCQHATPWAEVALLSAEPLGTSRGQSSRNSNPDEGASRMLLELGIPFEVLDLEADLHPYKVVILPDVFTLDEALIHKLEAFIAGGGKLLLSGQSGLDLSGRQFAKFVGLNWASASQWNPDYLVPTIESPTPRVRGPFVVHGGAQNVSEGRAPGSRVDWETLATRRDPYFNRNYAHFCSHQHTPDATDSEFPGVLSNGRIAYFAHSIFTAYRELGQPLLRDMVKDALASLLPLPLIQANLPSTARLYLNQQHDHNRAILHLLYATPQKRGADASRWGEGAHMVEVIEDPVPLHDVKVTLRPNRPVKSVRIVPEGPPLDFAFHVEEEAISFTVPQVYIHQMIEINF